jgi:hypothetical protein
MDGAPAIAGGDWPRELVLADSDFTRADVIRAAPGARRKMRTL